MNVPYFNKHFQEFSIECFSFEVQILCCFIQKFLLNWAKDVLDINIAIIFVWRWSTLILFLLSDLLFILHHISQSVEVLLDFLYLLLTELAMSDILLTQAKVSTVYIMVRAQTAKYFATESTVMFPPEKGKLLGAALASYACFIFEPCLSRT